MDPISIPKSPERRGSTSSQPSSPAKVLVNTPLKSNSGSGKGPVIAGSYECPYRLAIIGGGPSGCSIIVRAVRIGLASELCSFSFKSPSGTSSSSSAATSPLRSSMRTSDFMKDLENSIAAADTPTTFSEPNSSSSTPSSPSRSAGTSAATSSNSNMPKSAGVVMFDSGPLDRLGGGRLQDYVINSNTWIAKFASNVLEEKPDNLPPEHVRGTILDRLSNMNSTKEIVKIGNKTGPLQSVGVFLKDVGQVVYSLLTHQYPDSCKILVETKVEKMIKVVDSTTGKFLMWKITYATTTTPMIGTDIGATGTSSTTTHDVYAIHVVLATGGHQKLPKFANPAYNAKTISSDVVCTEQGVKQLKDILTKTCSAYAGAPNTGRVAIIGGSHSAFSAAWMVLNRVEEFEKKHDDPTKIKIGPSGICILFRSAIKVFYATKAEAEHDHYNQDGQICVNKVTGQINPFGGIRGDAKDLWKAIRSNREPRVRLLQVKSNIAMASSSGNSTTSSYNNNSSSNNSSSGGNANNFGGMKQSIVDKILDEAAVIVWACGYSANIFPIMDATGNSIRISMSKGQVDVDDQARVLYDGSHTLCVENLYGSGLGYGLKATLENGDPDGSSGRADGVAVYLKRGATLVLAHVLGNRVYGGMGINSWEQRNKLLRKQNIMNNAMGTASCSSDEQEIGGGGCNRLTLSLDSPSKPGAGQMLSPKLPLMASPSPGRPGTKHGNNNQATSVPVREQAKSAPIVVPSSPNTIKKSVGTERRPMSAGRSSTSSSASGSGGPVTPNRNNSNNHASSSITNSPAYQALKQEAMSAHIATPSPSKLLPSSAYKEGNSPVVVKKVPIPAVAHIPVSSSNSAPNTPHRSVSAPKTHLVTPSSGTKAAGGGAANQGANKTLPMRSSSGNSSATSSGGIALANGKRSATPTNTKLVSKSMPSPSINGVVVKPKPFPLPHVM